MRKYSVFALPAIVICFRVQAQTPITRSITVDSLGAFVQDDIVYLYGDRECGIVRSYRQIGDSLEYPHKEPTLAL